jgi:hypothetical protein
VSVASAFLFFLREDFRVCLVVEVEVVTGTCPSLALPPEDDPAVSEAITTSLSEAIGSTTFGFGESEPLPGWSGALCVTSSPPSVPVVSAFSAPASEETPDGDCGELVTDCGTDSDDRAAGMLVMKMWWRKEGDMFPIANTKRKGPTRGNADYVKFSRLI